MAMLVAASLLLLALGALGLEPDAGGPGARPVAPGLVATGFLALAVACLAWAWANTWVGRGLRHARPAARTAALVVALVNLFVLPFGTALSVYSLWVLLNDEVRQRFEGGPGARA